MTDQTAHDDTRCGSTPADPGTNLTAASLTDADRTALYPTVPADPPAVDLIDRHLLAAANYHAPPATRRDDARALYAALTADAAPYDAGDAPTTSRPLPIHDDLQRVTQERDHLAGLLARIGDTISPTGERPEEALGTLAADVEALVEQRDALQVALDRAHKVRIDAHGVIWHATPEGHWHHRIYGTRTRERIDEIFGKTRPALLVDIDTDDPPADWRINPADDQAAVLGSPPARAQDDLRPADWEQKAVDVAAGALAFLLGATPAAARRLATPAVRAIIDAGLAGPGGRCPRCQQPYPRTLPAGADPHCITCASDSDQPDPKPASEARRLLDRAVDIALPLSGGRVRKALKLLRRELARADALRAAKTEG
ncbi:hypothetical protein [Micromonospora echinospora]|uniref:hypothetical protein n=1 Tax=Micromonospora echinospora TaxID=1877 RepID=UPI003A84E3A6